jgi:hypothetical protein
MEAAVLRLQFAMIRGLQTTFDGHLRRADSAARAVGYFINPLVGPGSTAAAAREMRAAIP